MNVNINAGRIGLVFVAALMAGAGFVSAASAQRDTQLPPQQQQQKEERPLEYVLMKTGMGEIVLELNREKAPLTVANFLQYVEDDFYDGTIFHRVMPEFVIQGGGFTSGMIQKKTRDPVRNESDNGLSNTRGTIAMARLRDPDSATAQFFINVADNSRLDEPSPNYGGKGYTVFGKVAAGMEVVDKIRIVKTANIGTHQNVPVEPVVIQEMTRLTPEDAKKKIEELKDDESDVG